MRIAYCFDYPALRARALRDPVARLPPVLTGDPRAIADLGAAFLVAAGEQEAAADLSGTAAATLGAAVFLDDQAVVDPAAEVAMAEAASGASGARLTRLARSLLEVGERLAATGLRCCGLVETMYVDVASTRDHCQHAVDRTPPEVVAADLDTIVEPYRLAAVGQVRTCDDAVRDTVDRYDEFLVTQLGLIHSLGYVLPDGADIGVPTLAVAPVPGPDADPATVATWWAGLSAEQQAWLIENEGADLARTHGLPATVLDLVNRRLLADDAAVVQQEIDAVTAQILQPGAETTWPSTSAALAVLALLRRRQQNVARIQAALSSGPTTAGRRRTPYYLLEYDADGASGDGVAVLAIGNPDSADNLAVVVPGMGTGVDTLGGQVAGGSNLYDQMNQTDPSAQNAVIVYQGYDAPDGPQVLTDAAAEAGAEQLSADVAGWTAAAQQAQGDGQHLTVIGHSYGSIVASLAARGGMVLDDLVVVGSPGVDAWSVAQVGLDPEHFWVGAADGDVVVALGTPFGPFGPNPLLDDFGATVFTTGSAHGHHEYFADGTESLSNVAAIAVGDYGGVRVR